MKRRQILPLICLMLLLAACERPLQDETVDDTLPLATPAGDFIPLPDSGQVPESIPPLDLPGTTDNAQTDDGTGSDATTNDAAADPNAGNTDGAATDAGEGEGQNAVDDAASAGEETSTVQQPVEDTFYEIQSGDTLGSIAERFGVTSEDIMAANGLINEFIYAGDQLRIPGSSSSANDGASENANPSGAATIHTVRAGDTLYRIGLIYGFTVEELATFNSLTDMDSLDIGQEIAIPAR